MALNVRTSIFPLRVSLKGKESWELVLDITNADSKPSQVLLQMELPREATFKLAGYATRFQEQYKNVAPGKMVSLKVPVFVSRYAVPGNFLGNIKVSEHFNEYGYETQSYNRELLLKIVP